MLTDAYWDWNIKFKKRIKYSELNIMYIES